MPLKSWDDLYADADRFAPQVPLAVVGGADRGVLAALCMARDRGWIAPMVVGDEAQMRRTMADAGIALSGMELVAADDPAEAAVALVRAGRARLLMKGQVATPALMRAVLHPDTGLRTGRVICQVVLMQILPAQRQFLLADTGICVQPSLEQKIDILRSTADLARDLGAQPPRLALLAATETPTEAMPDTLDAAEIQQRNRSGQIQGCLVQGPLSFDLAYTADAGEKKRIAGPVVGNADAMIFPNLVAANLTVKAIMYTADCQYGGVLCGAACPVVFMSRADTVATRLNSIALALVRLRVGSGVQNSFLPRATSGE